MGTSEPAAGAVTGTWCDCRRVHETGGVVKPLVWHRELRIPSPRHVPFSLRGSGVCGRRGCSLQVPWGSSGVVSRSSLPCAQPGVSVVVVYGADWGHPSTPRRGRSGSVSDCCVRVRGAKRPCACVKVGSGMAGRVLTVGETVTVPLVCVPARPEVEPERAARHRTCVRMQRSRAVRGPRSSSDRLPWSTVLAPS